MTLKARFAPQLPVGRMQTARCLKERVFCLAKASGANTLGELDPGSRNGVRGELGKVEVLVWY